MKIGKKCLNRKFPSNRTGHRSTGATKNGFIVAPSLPEFQSDREKKFRKWTKNGTNPIRSLISKISVGLGFNCTFKVGDMTLHPNGFTSGAIFFGPATWLSIKGFPSVSSLNLRKAVKIVFLMSFHPPLLTIQSLLHPGFEPLIFCFSYVYH